MVSGELALEESKVLFVWAAGVSRAKTTGFKISARVLRQC